MTMKFLTLSGSIITVNANPKEARQCCIQSLKVNPYSLKMVGERATQTEVTVDLPPECHHVEVVVKQKAPKREHGE